MAYVHDYDAFGELVLREDWMLAEMTERAEKVKTLAEAIAPFDPEDKKSLHYKEAFRVETSTHGGAHSDRAEAKVVNDDPIAVYVEYGTRNNPAHHTLTRALDAAGD